MSTNPPSSTPGEDFSAMLSEHLSQSSVSNFERDQLVSGRIISIAEREILIELNAKSEGIVKGRDIEALPKDVRAALKVGDEVYA
jgi:ribosomal protein S1